MSASSNPWAALKPYHTRRGLFSLIAVGVVIILAFQFFHTSSPYYPKGAPMGHNPPPKQHPSDGQHEGQRPPPPPMHGTPMPPPPPGSLESILGQLYKPMIHPMTAPEFRAIDGNTYTMNNTPIWTEPLGKDFCIIDVDNRPFNNTDEFMNPEPLNYEKFHYYGSGVLNHYLYALIHGYSYHFMRNDGYPNRAPNWAKPRGFLDMLKLNQCRFVLLIDADAAFVSLELPFEWLLNRWGVTPNTAISIPKDPLNNEPNYDSKGRVNNNSGFVVAQNLPVTIDIAEAWIDCPDNEKKYPGCDRFRFRDFCEQGAWSEYTRYGFPNDILELECNDVNGYPGSGRPCSGVFVRHHWDKKYLTKHSSADALLYNMMMRLQQDLWNTEGITIET